MTDLDVIQNGKIIFSGEDYEIAEFINSIHRIEWGTEMISNEN